MVDLLYMGMTFSYYVFPEEDFNEALITGFSHDIDLDDYQNFGNYVTIDKAGLGLEEYLSQFYLQCPELRFMIGGMFRFTGEKITEFEPGVGYVPARAVTVIYNFLKDIDFTKTHPLIDDYELENLTELVDFYGAVSELNHPLICIIG